MSTVIITPTIAPQTPYINLQRREPPKEDPQAEFDKLTFNQAFAKARKQHGANGTFKWRGRLYGTKLASEVEPKPKQKATEKKTTSSSVADSSKKSDKTNNKPK